MLKTATTKTYSFYRNIIDSGVEETLTRTGFEPMTSRCTVPALYQLSYLALSCLSPCFVNIFVLGCRNNIIVYTRHNVSTFVHHSQLSFLNPRTISTLGRRMNLAPHRRHSSTLGALVPTTTINTQPKQWARNEGRIHWGIHIRWSLAMVNPPTQYVLFVISFLLELRPIFHKVFKHKNSLNTE